MPLQLRLLDILLVAFVALKRERDAVLELLVVQSPAAGGEGGAANFAQGSPLLGLISRGGVFWQPCKLRLLHVLSFEVIDENDDMLETSSSLRIFRPQKNGRILTGFFLQIILCFLRPLSVLNSMLQNLHGSTLICTSLCLKWFNKRFGCAKVQCQ